MDYLKFLSTYSVLRRVLRDSSERTGDWRRYFFCGPLANFVCKVKRDYKTDFEECLDPHGLFVEQLLSGDLELYITRVVPTLQLDSPGRIATSLAFVAYLLDIWDCNNQFSPDFSLDALCIPLWKAICEKVRAGNLQGAAAVFQQEMEREGLLLPQILVPETPLRVDSENGDLHLAEMVEVADSQGDQEVPIAAQEVIVVDSDSEEESVEVETEGDSELEVVFESNSDSSQRRGTPYPDVRGMEGMLSSSSEEEIFSPLSGVAPLASSDSCYSDSEEEDQGDPEPLPLGEDPGLDQEID
uniref:E1B 19 kDa protein n=1 Tax=Rhinolophus ferrumequinum adenovirus TaxID=3140013 RepID=A0AAU6S560_9ADEN